MNGLQAPAAAAAVVVQQPAVAEAVAVDAVHGVPVDAPLAHVAPNASALQKLLRAWWLWAVFLVTLLLTAGMWALGVSPTAVAAATFEVAAAAFKAAVAVVEQRC
jgi:hypothetical protein